MFRRFHLSDAGDRFLLNSSFALETGRRRTIRRPLERSSTETERADLEGVAAGTGGKPVIGDGGSHPVLQLVALPEKRLPSH